jgi:thiamine-phosphate pyrophosphorylase
MSLDAPRLYLATPPLVAARDFLPALEAALSAGDVASLLIRFGAVDAREREAVAKTLAPLAQARDVAALVEGDPSIALRAGADGAHVSGSGEALAAAVTKLSPRYIVGAGDLASRDDAMRAGELGADYVLFEAEDFDARLAQVDWWAELFNTPCVARAATLGEIAPLTRAGADFILLDDAVWDDARGPAAAVAQALETLSQGRAHE